MTEKLKNSFHTMQAIYFHVDAFTKHVFAGNPAGVCQLGIVKWPSDEILQRIAAENGLSETAFLPLLSLNNEYDLRWFTPTMEVDLCGHATLAAAHVIWR